MNRGKKKPQKSESAKIQMPHGVRKSLHKQEELTQVEKSKQHPICTSERSCEISKGVVLSKYVRLIQIKNCLNSQRY